LRAEAAGRKKSCKAIAQTLDTEWPPARQTTTTKEADGQTKPESQAGHAAPKGKEGNGTHQTKNPGLTRAGPASIIGE